MRALEPDRLAAAIQVSDANPLVGLEGRIDDLAFVNSTAGEESWSGLGPWHGVRIVYLVTVTGGALRSEVDESSDLAEWATLPHLDGRPVVDLVEAALAWLGVEHSAPEK